MRFHGEVDDFLERQLFTFFWIKSFSAIIRVWKVLRPVVWSPHGPLFSLRSFTAQLPGRLIFKRITTFRVQAPTDQSIQMLIEYLPLKRDASSKKLVWQQLYPEQHSVQESVLVTASVFMRGFQYHFQLYQLLKHMGLYPTGSSVQALVKENQLKIHCPMLTLLGKQPPIELS